MIKLRKILLSFVLVCGFSVASAMNRGSNPVEKFCEFVYGRRYVVTGVIHEKTSKPRQLYSRGASSSECDEFVSNRDAGAPSREEVQEMFNGHSTRKQDQVMQCSREKGRFVPCAPTVLVGLKGSDLDDSPKSVADKSRFDV